MRKISVWAGLAAGVATFSPQAVSAAWFSGLDRSVVEQSSGQLLGKVQRVSDDDSDAPNSAPGPGESGGSNNGGGGGSDDQAQNDDQSDSDDSSSSASSSGSGDRDETLRCVKLDDVGTILRVTHPRYRLSKGSCPMGYEDLRYSKTRRIAELSGRQGYTKFALRKSGGDVHLVPLKAGKTFASVQTSTYAHLNSSSSVSKRVRLTPTEPRRAATRIKRHRTACVKIMKSGRVEQSDISGVTEVRDCPKGYSLLRYYKGRKRAKLTSASGLFHYYNVHWSKTGAYLAPRSGGTAALRKVIEAQKAEVKQRRVAAKKRRLAAERRQKLALHRKSCFRRYKSYDPGSNFYWTYSGRARICRSKYQ